MKTTKLLVPAGLLLLTAACDKPREDTRPTETRSGTVAPQEAQPVETTSKAKTNVQPSTKNALDSVDSDMKEVLESYAALNPQPIEKGSPADARKQPTMSDGVRAALQKKGKAVDPLPMAGIENKKFKGPGGDLPIRIYTPKTDAKGPLPVIVYFHGGGFVIANNDAYDASARGLAQEAKAKVVAVDYRQAPEHKFPAAHDDAFATYDWVVKNAASFGGDPKRVAVAGESAGGNLAANVSIMARDKGIQMPTHQLLVYPVASTATDSKSYQEWADAKPLNKPMMGWFMTQYTRSPEDAKDTRLDLVNANLKGLPETTIILAEVDPLRSGGENLAAKLEAAGVKVKSKTYEGVTHEFFGAYAAVADAKSAVEMAGDRLEDSFEAKKP